MKGFCFLDHLQECQLAIQGSKLSMMGYLARKECDAPGWRRAESSLSARESASELCSEEGISSGEPCLLFLPCTLVRTFLLLEAWVLLLV